MTIELGIINISEFCNSKMSIFYKMNKITNSLLTIKLI